MVCWDPVKDHLEHLNIDAFLKHVDTAFVESLVLYEGGNITSAHTNILISTVVNVIPFDGIVPSYDVSTLI